MTMPDGPVVLQIVVTSLLVAIVVALAAVLLLRVLRRRGLRAQLMVVASAGTVAMAGAVVAIALEMYLSAHDLTILLTVIAVSLVLGLGMAWCMARTVRAWV